jgi:hypothetical protein
MDDADTWRAVRRGLEADGQGPVGRVLDLEFGRGQPTVPEAIRRRLAEQARAMDEATACAGEDIEVVALRVRYERAAH